MSTFLRALSDLIPRALARLTSEPELQEVPATVGRWRGIFVSPETQAVKDLFVYASTREQAQALFAAVKEIHDPTNPLRTVTIGQDGWQLSSVEPDDSDWQPKLVNDFYKPETRAG
jgi:hypothetical protein